MLESGSGFHGSASIPSPRQAWISTWNQTPDESSSIDSRIEITITSIWHAKERNSRAILSAVRTGSNREAFLFSTTSWTDIVRIQETDHRYVKDGRESNPKRARSCFVDARSIELQLASITNIEDVRESERWSKKGLRTDRSYLTQRKTIRFRIPSYRIRKGKESDGSGTSLPTLCRFVFFFFLGSR